MGMEDHVSTGLSEFPFKSALSLRPLLDFWQSEASSDDTVRKSVATRVLDAVHAQLEEGTRNGSDAWVAQHPDLLRLLLSAVFAPAQWSTDLLAAAAPFRMEPVIASERFREFGLTPSRTAGIRTGSQVVSAERLIEAKSLSAWHLILNRMYDLDVETEVPVTVDRLDPETGLMTFHKVSFDLRFVNVSVHGTLPELSSESLRHVLSHPDDLATWHRVLPPEAFSFEGVVILQVSDVTQEEALSRLRHELLTKEALVTGHRFDVLEQWMQALLGVPSARLGLIALDRCEMGEVGGARAIGRSILLRRGLPECSRPKDSIYFQVIESGHSLILPDVTEVPNNTRFEYRLQEENIRSLYLAPLKVDDSVVGILEIGARKEHSLNSLQAGKLRELAGIFGVALGRSLDEQEDRVQALIKRQYTSIHPVVEWKFRKAALDHLSRAERNEEGEWPVITFTDVYPLFGSSDIRGSSALRSEAIQRDLAKQLGLAMAVIIAASTFRPRPSLDEIGFRLSNLLERVLTGLGSGEETSLISLLKTEIEPLFAVFRSWSPDVARSIDQYNHALDPALGFVFEARHQYEQAVTTVVDAVSSLLDRRNEEAQAMLPHFFERFKTDGVEHNIYAGPDLLQGSSFSELDLNNLRIWQLITMSEASAAAQRVQEEMQTPLELAHLILVQSEPLDIRFREDEKRFDVDGAYNIRYEIVKKRIDKARKADSDERITQPGCLSVIYALDEERDQYVRYLEYLTAAGWFEGPMEHLQLEELPGAASLRAIRIKISTSPPGRPFLSIPEPDQARSGASSVRTHE